MLIDSVGDGDIADRGDAMLVGKEGALMAMASVIDDGKLKIGKRSDGEEWIQG